MPIQKTSSSRFRETEPIIRNGKETYGLWVRPAVVNPDNLEDSDIMTLQATQTNAGRPDLIATEYYGTPQLEWVVVMFNKPLNPLGWPQAGVIYKIPRPQVVRALL